MLRHTSRHRNPAMESPQAMPRFTDEHIPTVVARLSHAMDEEWRTTLRKLWAPVNLMEWRILAALADGEPETLTRVAER